MGGRLPLAVIGCGRAGDCVPRDSNYRYEASVLCGGEGHCICQCCHGSLVHLAVECDLGLQSQTSNLMPTGSVRVMSSPLRHCELAILSFLH